MILTKVCAQSHVHFLVPYSDIPVRFQHNRKDQQKIKDHFNAWLFIKILFIIGTVTFEISGYEITESS